MNVRSLLLAGALAAAFAAPAGARPAADTAATAQQAGVADPAAYIESVLKGEVNAPFDGPNSKNPLYTQRLRNAFAEDEAYADGEVGRLDFDIFTGAQDGDLSDIQVEASDVDGAPDRKVVTARFKNGDLPTVVVFYFERADGRWLIDDVASTGYDNNPWTLSLILRFGSVDTSVPPTGGY